MNPRDTQFQGWAKLLLDELLGDWEFGYIDVSRRREPQECAEMETIMARRAYDLVEHVIGNIVPDDLLERTDKKSIAEVACSIPDMTQWPKEQE